MIGRFIACACVAGCGFSFGALADDPFSIRFAIVIGLSVASYKLLALESKN